MFEGRITVDPKVHFGQPYVAVTRIPVYAVLELVQEGIPFHKYCLSTMLSFHR